jgi:hypothetical protein
MVHPISRSASGRRYPRAEKLHRKRCRSIIFPTRRPRQHRPLCARCAVAVGPKNAGYCHRWDFTSEAARIRALLDRYGETCIDRSSEPEEA